jgi:hypothetical protein
MLIIWAGVHYRKSDEGFLRLARGDKDTPMLRTEVKLS